MKKYFDDILKSIEASVNSMDFGRFNELADCCMKTIEDGHKVIVSGLGKNVPVCEKFVGTMNSLGQPAAFMNTNSAVHGDIGMVAEGDLVIILTKSGETVESVYLERLLENRNCGIWLLTFEQNSTLFGRLGSQHCLVLHLDDEGDQWNIVPNNSTTVNLIVLQGLAMEIVKRRGVTLYDFKKNHPSGHIGEQLKNV